MTHKRKLGLASFFMPVFLMAVAMVILKVFPFGNHTFLIWDMDWQYSSFFVHLHDILHGEASAWYSLSRAIGGDMIGVSAYYLISPFNILFLYRYLHRDDFENRVDRMEHELLSYDKT